MSSRKRAELELQLNHGDDVARTPFEWSSGESQVRDDLRAEDVTRSLVLRDVLGTPQFAARPGTKLERADDQLGKLIDEALETMILAMISAWSGRRLVDDLYRLYRLDWLDTP